MKSNIEYLRELIKDNDEAVEFLDAVVNEIKVIQDEKISLENVNSSLHDEISELAACLEISEDLETVDLGIGKIYYRTDNVKLQCLMEDFKEKHATHYSQF